MVEMTLILGWIRMVLDETCESLVRCSRAMKPWRHRTMPAMPFRQAASCVALSPLELENSNRNRTSFSVGGGKLGDRRSSWKNAHGFCRSIAVLIHIKSPKGIVWL